MEIKQDPIDVIMAKLVKIRCSSGCLNNINYLVFGHGLYCSSCLSNLPELTTDHFVNLQNLAGIIIQLTNQYSQRTKGGTSQLNLLRGQMQSVKKQVKKSKQTLIYDARTVKEKSIATIDELYGQCVKQNQNQPLQSFYEPDITATLILNESELLLQNLENLAIQEKDGKIQYRLVEAHKHPQKINKKIDKQYKRLQECIQKADAQCQAIIDNFMNEVNGDV